MEVTATGHGLNAPVGEGTLGRMFDPLGRPIDGKGPVDDLPHWPIHRKAPSFAEQKPATEILETGIKVVDLICPYAKGGKIGLFGGAGVGKTVLIMELILLPEDATVTSISVIPAAISFHLSTTCAVVRVLFLIRSAVRVALEPLMDTE